MLVSVIEPGTSESRNSDPHTTGTVYPIRHNALVSDSVRFALIYISQLIVVVVVVVVVEGSLTAVLLALRRDSIL
jgi:hypothetical protein